MSSLKNKALDIAQRYCGMTPKDLGVETYAEMQEKMANEIVSLANKNNVVLVGAGRHDEIVEKIVHYGKSVGRDFSMIAAHDIGDTVGFGKTRDASYLMSDVIKKNNDYLLKETNELQKEIKEIDEVGIRGITNNRKTKKRKKAKNGKRKKK